VWLLSQLCVVFPMRGADSLGIKATDDAAQARLQPATIISPHRPKAMTQAAILAHILTGARD
jgi:hypothetical protein